MPAPAKRASAKPATRASSSRPATNSGVAKSPARSAKLAGPKGSPSPKQLGALPAWNLADLYAGLDDPNVKRDLDRADSYSKAFEEDFKGKLASLAEGPEAGRKLADAIKRFEALDDLL